VTLAGPGDRLPVALGPAKERRAQLFVTNPERLRRGIAEKSVNSLLVKVNQIGTVSETFDAVSMAHRAGFSCMISHRSGETDDTFIADLQKGGVPAGDGAPESVYDCRILINTG
jgi:hypothetical protein